MLKLRDPAIPPTVKRKSNSLTPVGQSATTWLRTMKKELSRDANQRRQDDRCRARPSTRGR
jgi:hypothetical protein